MASSKKPGILYVTMQPKSHLPAAKFHDWYNNEHGPTRLRLPFVKNGYRYRATDLEGRGKGDHEWMAIYDIEDMNELTKETYTSLRTPAVKTERETQTMKEIDVERRLFDLVQSDQATALQGLESEEGSYVKIAVLSRVLPGKLEELRSWYDKEHISLLSKVAGWRRSRQFLNSSIDPRDGDVEYFVLHEYDSENGLAGKEFQEAISTTWMKEIMEKVVKEMKIRRFELYYTFGPAPRDLSSLARLDTKPFISRDGTTRTLATQGGGSGVIDSYVTTLDGAILPYRLEGKPDDKAPLIVLVNSILVEWGIWDGFIESFFSSSEQNRKYRILRYHTRGRTTEYGSQACTLDRLSADVVSLLNALRVPKASAVIGVSLGGATALNTALKYPDRVDSFIACDTNAKSPDGNRKAWGDRIAIAEKENAEGGTIVGEELAEMTTRRWFVKESYDCGDIEDRTKAVKKMVETNSLDGFKRSVEALFDYDVREEMKSYEGKGAFVVGSGDGALPDTMKEMASSLGKGARLEVMDQAGHLPMVEQPQKFAELVARHLQIV